MIVNIGTQFRQITIKLDKEDAERVLQQTWQITPPSITTKINGKTISLARFLKQEMECEINHKNRDPFDYQKQNLRIATHHQNMMSREVPKNNTSGYKGVTQNKRAKKYQAQIMFNKENIYLGLHKTKIEAAQAYDRKAIELFGEFAQLNFPETANV